MSTTLYKEAIAEAHQLKELAEQNAKNKIIEALTPRIQAMVESQLLSEQQEIEIEDLDLDDDGTIDMSAMEVPSLDAALADELIGDDESEDSSAAEASVIINAQGDVNVAVQEAVKNNVKNIKEVIKNSTSSNGNKLANKIAKLQTKVRRMDALLESIDASALSNQQRAVIKQSYRKLLGEALTLRSEVIIISEGGEQRLRLQLFNTLKEMNTMTKNRSRAIFNQLFEAGYGELDEMELVLSDEDLEALGVEDAEDADVDALDLEVLMDEESFEGEEEEAEAEEVEAEDEEGEEEEAELELGELDEVFEIDPRVLRRELRRLKTIREQAEEEADQFGGGEVELEVMEVDEEDLLNALADELGTVDSIAKAAEATTGPVAETRRRRRSRANGRARTQRTSNTVRENRELKKQLSEMNLFNAKLLYVNKLIQNRNVSSKQQRAIVEALDNAKTIREAKLVFEGLTKSLNKKSLSEGKRRVLGSSSKPTRSGSATVNESAQTNRWATLAGIKSK
tara:strand:+ start:1007 stop:2539 length:1533 start_codon:yes stop_codon:yes gene_type:complete